MNLDGVAQVVVLRPGDKVVFNFAYDLSETEVVEHDRRIKAAFPDISGLVVSGCTVTVLRNESDGAPIAKTFLTLPMIKTV